MRQAETPLERCDGEFAVPVRSAGFVQFDGVRRVETSSTS